MLQNEGRFILCASNIQDFSCKSYASINGEGTIAGVAVGLKNWLRVTFAVEPSSLEEGLKRIKSFYERHAKKQ